MAHQCVFCGAMLSESAKWTAAGDGPVSVSTCPRCGNFSGRPESTSASERAHKMARLSKAVRVVSGQPFKEPYRLGVAMAGVLLLLFCTFCPLLQLQENQSFVNGARMRVTSTASMNLFVLHPPAAALQIMVVFLAFGLSFWRYYSGLWLPALASVFIYSGAILTIAERCQPLYPAWGIAVVIIALVPILITTRDRLPHRG